MRTSVKLAAILSLLLFPLPLAATDTPAPAKPAAGEATPAQSLADRALAQAAGQTDRELLLSILTRLFQLEDRLATLERKSQSDLGALRQGVQSALNQVGVEIGTLRAQFQKLSARPAPPSTPAEPTK